MIDCDRNTIMGYEDGAGAGAAAVNKRLRKLCAAYQRTAEERGYDAALFHESILCPNDFPPLKQQPERAA